MIPFEIKAIVSDEEGASGDHTVYLFNKGKNLILPIKVNENSVNALMMAREGTREIRPHVHNTAARLIKVLNGKIEKIIVSGYEDDIFYSYIRVSQGNSSFDIDSKPSDAFALALRTNAPIYVQTSVVEKVGILVTPEMLT